MYLDQRVSVATQVAIVASACLVAALALLYTRSEGDDLAKQIAHVLGTLVVLADPGNGPTPNEVLLLVRDS